ncbi:MAG TPA: hypothetical protein ENH91_11570 [Leeuwenhoekiella sp.]|nr:hypothetical protein [Leeuwenhoekiella sp.]
MKKNWESYSDSGFKVPETYFDTFEEHLKENLRLVDMAAHKEDGFSVPQGYFESLDTRIKNKKVMILWPLNKRFITGALAAAAAALILVLFLWNPAPQENTFENLSASTLHDYLADEGIQEFMTEDDLTKIEDNNSIFQSFTMSDDLLFEMIDDQVLEDELVPEISDK